MGDMFRRMFDGGKKVNTRPSRAMEERFWAYVMERFNENNFYVPKHGATNIPYAVGGRKFRVNLDITGAPRTVDVPNAKPGKAPISAILVKGNRGAADSLGRVRVGADRVYYDAETDGSAVVEVTY